MSNFRAIVYTKGYKYKLEIESFAQVTDPLDYERVYLFLNGRIVHMIGVEKDGKDGNYSVEELFTLERLYTTGLLSTLYS